MSTTSSHSKRIGARALAIGAAVAATIGTAFVAGPVSADEFTPQNNPPTLTSPSFTMPGAQTEFEPDGGASDEVYEYSVTVTDADSLEDVDKVEICLNHSLNEDGASAGDGDATCATTDARNSVLLTWTRATDTFAIDGGGSTFWALGTDGDVSTSPTDLTATSGELTFRFTVSEAMREGTWTASGTATDMSSATGTNDEASATVAAYSAITTRVQQDFGILAANTGATATDSPTVISNGTTELSLTAGDFTSGTYTFALESAGATSTTPDAGKVTFDCITGAAFDESTATRVGSTATSLGTATATGTAEGGTAVDNTCRLTHGGGRPVDTYGFVVVNTISNA
jgi:hypothetical protein